MIRKGTFCRYALTAPVPGDDDVIYTMRTTLSKLMNQDMFIFTVPASNAKEFPIRVQLLDGTLLPVVFSSSPDPAFPTGLFADRLYLGSVICVAGAPTLNVLNAVMPAAAPR